MMSIHLILDRESTDTPRTQPLAVGEHIFRHDRLSLSLGAMHCWGLYHDWPNRIWYVTDRGHVHAIFGDGEYREAARLYGEKCGR